MYLFSTSPNEQHINTHATTGWLLARKPIPVLTGRCFWAEETNKTFDRRLYQNTGWCRNIPRCRKAADVPSLVTSPPGSCYGAAQKWREDVAFYLPIPHPAHQSLICPSDWAQKRHGYMMKNSMTLIWHLQLLLLLLPLFFFGPVNCFQ